MDKYKLCPSCNERNLPTMVECSHCDTDLMTVRIVDEKSEQLLTEQIKKTPILSESVRICDCGTHNTPGARKCTTCNEDISDIQPTIAPATNTAQFLLASLDGAFTFEMREPISTIGRDQEMKEYLADKNYVSRSHAKLTITNGELYITNLSNTNFTFVNNEKITGDVPKRLIDGDEVGLGGLCLEGVRQKQAAYFLVRIGS